MGRRRLRKRANGEGSIYRRSDGRWAAEVTVGYDARGRQQKSRVYGRTQSEAVEKLKELKGRLAQGLPPKPERQTVAQFLRTWLETVCPTTTGSPKTRRTYRDLIEDHVIPGLGRIELSKLSPEHVQKWINDFLKRPKPERKVGDRHSNTSEMQSPDSQECYSAKTVKHCRDVLRAALNVAMQWNLVSRNAAALTKINGQRKRRMHANLSVYDQRQARAFLKAIEGERLEALFWLALCIGSREGELLGLMWIDVNFENGTILVLRSLQRIKREEEKKSHLELPR
jgi:integrase